MREASKCHKMFSVQTQKMLATAILEEVLRLKGGIGEGGLWYYMMVCKVSLMVGWGGGVTKNLRENIKHHSLPSI